MACEISMSFLNPVHEYSVKLGIFSKTYCEIVHFLAT